MFHAEADAAHGPVVPAPGRDEDLIGGLRSEKEPPWYQERYGDHLLGSVVGARIPPLCLSPSRSPFVLSEGHPIHSPSRSFTRKYACALALRKQSARYDRGGVWDPGGMIFARHPGFYSEQNVLGFPWSACDCKGQKAKNGGEGPDRSAAAVDLLRVFHAACAAWLAEG